MLSYPIQQQIKSHLMMMRLRKFEYPFESFCEEYGSWNFSSIIGEQDICCNDAPQRITNMNNITEIYFQQDGEKDEETWILVYHTNAYGGLYVYFEASCDYTGFDCRGGGEVKYSRNYDNLIRFGLPEEVRNLMKK